jgi:hypothetical protein
MTGVGTRVTKDPIGLSAFTYLPSGTTTALKIRQVRVFNSQNCLERANGAK